MSIKLIVLIIGSIIGGILGRMGGTSLGTRWRDIGVSAVIVALIACFGHLRGLPAWLALLPCFGLMWGALTTYRYFLPKPKDYTWPYYALHGFFVSLAILPILFFTGSWLGFWIRCVANALLVGLWSKWISNDTIEEFGRYFIITFSLFLVLH